jgi:hypothetical protein
MWRTKPSSTVRYLEKGMAYKSAFDELTTIRVQGGYVATTT